ncbi:hypothetical protein QBC33DRAFT_549447 [Phialemonium atrogriseum]|uniref:MFS maltose permease n=1 Tax=Phialemonium atrogriseum TaxID=1093897 RepID=A0AAJ0BT78_9PEZI|nr:uncharacterized protein QBC33DRAFT_549447 [Phialemonium atrogriseum]KAK1763592.1 hypothetical protein QBC33DRAFT_549447 [Phialemonium atrogriseum]
MRPRLLIRQIPLRLSQKRSLLRTFTQNTSVRAKGARPQLPFLSIPTTTRQSQRVRYLTTERKQWIKYEFKLGIKYTVYFWIALVCVAAGTFAVQQEILERQYPTPHEWRFLTRTRFKSAHAEKDRKDSQMPDWVVIMELIQGVVERLEDSKLDGKGVTNAASDAPPRTKDISAMPEHWRRGYYEAIMLYAAAAEHLDGWVVDRTRKIVFPPEVVIGPSNPRPKPIPPSSKSAPREEDCEVAYTSPDDIYTRIISTPGFTDRQRMDASLAYANWLEFKGLAGPASIMYERALDLAVSSRPPNTPNPVNNKTWILNDAAGNPTANILTSLTALATFQARAGNVSAALPIFISILKARRSLPIADEPDAPSPFARKEAPGFSVDKVMKSLKGILLPPSYPASPDDGNTPPIRGPKELCEEAALNLHIGEIMYATRATSREEGLGWTREAVDMAEEQLHKLGGSGGGVSDRGARTTCRECLATGLSNWATMVARLAREEAARKEGPQPRSGGGWFGLWGEGKPEDLDRWAAEEKVIQERQRRAAELLDDLEPPPSGTSSIFHA